MCALRAHVLMQSGNKSFDCYPTSSLDTFNVRKHHYFGITDYVIMGNRLNTVKKRILEVIPIIIYLYL